MTQATSSTIDLPASDGTLLRVEPGMTILLGRNRGHTLINTGLPELHWTWPSVPNGLETSFEAIGGPRQPGEAPPALFPRRDTMLRLECDTVFGAPIPDGPGKP